ncbi:MAG: hypothetical protein LDL33_13495 [Desulfomonile sp.]|nr:hypothetical protein [Desulfomonile sp.]
MTKLEMLAAFILVGAAATSPAFGQAVGDSAANLPAGTGQILGNFLTIERAAIQRELRVVTRCIRMARENLRDIQGNINRVAQTDLLNCNRRLQQLLRDEAKLGRIAARRAAEAEAAAQLSAAGRQRNMGSRSSQ